MKTLPKFLNLTGIIIMLTLIICTIPLTIPKLFGFQIYAVLTGSMEPEYPVGSVVYVEPAAPDIIQIGDVITFRLPEEANVVMTHRVMNIDQENGFFVTKGDANPGEDEEPVEFERLIGKAVYDIPKLAAVSNLINTMTGKLILFSLFALSFILWIIADIITQMNKKAKHLSEMLHDADKAVNANKSPNTNNKKNTISFRSLLRAGFVILLVISAVGLFATITEYSVAKNEYRSLQEAVAETPKDKNSSDDGTENSVASFEPNTAIINEFQSLKSQNPDMAAWIAFDTLDISYPVMHGEDNTYYLTHTFSGKTNSSGSIFMEVGNSNDFNDCHTLLYGHNMKNGSMFGLLKKYRDEEFYQGNEFFTIYLDDRYYRYQIFSVHTVSITDPVYTIGFAANQEFSDWVEQLNRQAWYDTGTKAGIGDKVITLSTCSSSDKVRYVVHGMRVGEELIK